MMRKYSPISFSLEISLTDTQWRSYSSAKAFFDALEKCMMCDDALDFLKLFALFWICAHIYNKDPFSGI